MASCPPCGSPVTRIAAIEEPAVIAKILAHLSFPTRGSPLTPDRTWEFVQTTNYQPGFRFIS